MFLLDAPYVSDFLLKSVKGLNQPVLDTPEARRFAAGAGIELIDEIEFAARMAMGQRIYANSENGLAKLMDCGCNDDLARRIGVCKDKALFRETVAGVHPDYRFMRVPLEELETVDVSAMPYPFVAKPARGFFSLGVHIVNTLEEWPDVVRAIMAERDALNREYPEAVVDAGEFLLEESLRGEEYAIDVYFDGAGEPVILNILHHHFVSDDDVSDRLYYTSASIIRQWLEPFTAYCASIGEACGLRDFPIHLEVRVDEAGAINSIEANPLRFAGWCVADLTFHAWGFNPYEYYFADKRPDWPALLAEHEGRACAMVIGDVPPGVDRDAIVSVDLDGFADMLGGVLELRPIDHSEYPVFAFAFLGLPEADLDGLKERATSDFSRFLVTG
ncbi:ATP-grasp domain-containing protein [Pseudodesulfovibrio cashew]|uniref:ATP-grasp domain-containing protein n=1 Tax=Pseudodesulfovibrio cashew TaxID=2678688 RepID=A0A6I6J8K1_9BACT|nr:ATP-grasp domain-containing protein [Pseudodesulfovibrio cashew]QGY39156.1 ATP-grasp domain-containing protein [Pseudodesulfovibrio cashew]